MRVTAKALYNPAGTSYAVYEAKMSNGDSHSAGAFSEEEFRRDTMIWYEEGVKIVSVRKLAAHDTGNGLMETESI